MLASRWARGRPAAGPPKTGGPPPFIAGADPGLSWAAR